jgi:hypothetical protein
MVAFLPLPLCSLNVTLHAAGAGIAKREHCAAPPNHSGAKKLQLKIKLNLSADVQAPLPSCSLNVTLHAAGAGIAKREHHAARHKLIVQGMLLRSAKITLHHTSWECVA